jgi:hypothetical protein
MEAVAFDMFEMGDLLKSSPKLLDRQIQSIVVHVLSSSF